MFTIESGFNVDLGTLGQGGRAWGRQSFVGLGGSWGRVTLGRQYDFLYVNALPADMGASAVGSLVGATDGAGTSVDTHMGGTRYDNTIKWTHAIGPWRGGLMYGLGNENTTDKMALALLAYRQGPVNVGVAYVRDNYVPAALLAGNKVWATTGHYDLSPDLKPVASYADARQASGLARNRRLQLGSVYKPTEATAIGILLARANTKSTSGTAATMSVDGDHQTVLRTGIRYVF